MRRDVLVLFVLCIADNIHVQYGQLYFYSHQACHHHGHIIILQASAFVARPLKPLNIFEYMPLKYAKYTENNYIAKLDSKTNMTKFDSNCTSL